MNFRTECIPHPFSFHIHHQSRILAMGSCFAERIGARLADAKFPVMLQPFGTVYHPSALFRLLNAGLEDEFPSHFKKHLVNREDAWFSLDFHSAIWEKNEDELWMRMNAVRKQAGDFLKQADVLMLTVGTADFWTYEETGMQVANCQKIPARQFSQGTSSAEDLLLEFEMLLRKIEAINPAVQVLLTLSPVRHLRAGFERNAFSKAILRIFCGNASNRFQNVHYFPAYEIMMDDLRDYRFYSADNIHPNELAEDYIWEKFSNSFFNSQTKKLNKEWESVRLALQHKPFRAHSAAHQKFLENIRSRLIRLSSEMDVRNELESLSAGE